MIGWYKSLDNLEITNKEQAVKTSIASNNVDSQS